MVQSSTQNPFPRSHSHFSKNSHFFRWKFGSRTGERRTSGRCRKTGCLQRIMREPKKETWRGTRTWSTTRRRRTTLTTTSNIPTTLMTPSSPSPRIGSHRGLQGSSKVPWGPALGPNMDFNQCEASLVPNQHFASPMIDYFLLSRVPKKFRIELFALNICRWMMICTSPPWIIECHKK